MLSETLGRLTFLVAFPFLVMVVVGGLYYLVTRPRYTFKDAVFRPWNVLLGVLALFLAMCGQIVTSLG